MMKHLKHRIIKLIVSCTMFFSIAAYGQGQSPNPNKVYAPEVKSVQIYPKFGHYSHKDVQPAIFLSEDTKVMLEFDLLGQGSDPLQAKIIHCNADWRPSQFRGIDFLESYNEFNSDEAEFSINTKVDYTHYVFALPKPKLSGNYLVKVYRYGEEDSPLLERGFIVYDNLVDINAEMGAIGDAEDARRKHRIDFKVRYGRVNLQNPNTNVKVVIRQNGRWDNALRGLRPLYIRDNIKELDYYFFGDENCFMAGNEFRYFSNKSFRNGGFNSKSFDIKSTPVVTYLHEDKSRGGKAYSQVMDDHNGTFKIEIDESVKDELEADYSKVRFRLKVAEQPAGEAYVLGAFNDWSPQEESKMSFDAAKSAYIADILLKQGTYDYFYTLIDGDKRDDAYFENSHSQTKNQYEIIVYYRAPGAQGDAVIGYFNIYP